MKNQVLSLFFVLFPFLGFSQYHNGKPVTFYVDKVPYFGKEKIADKPTEGSLYYYKIKDEKNGYVVITGAMEGEVIMTVFRTQLGYDLLAIDASECGPVCNHHYHLFRVNAKTNALEDRIDNILPMLEMINYTEALEDELRKKSPKLFNDSDAGEGLYWEIDWPRYGTDVKMKVKLGPDGELFSKKCATLSFDKKKFVFKTKSGIK